MKLNLYSRANVLLVVVYMLFSCTTIYAQESCQDALTRAHVLRLQERRLNQLQRGSLEAQRKQHLAEFEAQAKEMAEVLATKMINPSLLRQTLKPYIEKLKQDKEIKIKRWLFVYFEAKRPAEAVIEFLERILNEDLLADIHSAINNKSLSIDKMFDLSLRWTTTLTILERAAQEKEALTKDEAFRLWEFLNGQQQTFVRMFPYAYFQFHIKPMSIESIVGLTADPVFPLQLATETVDHAAEGQRMSPLYTFLHDVFHSIQRINQNMTWMFPDNSPYAYFPDVFYEKDSYFIKEFVLTPEWIATITPAHSANKAFLKFIFANANSYPAHIRTSVELIWFQLYFAEKQLADDKSMSPSGLKEMLNKKMYFAPLVREAQSGELGQNYLNVTEESLNEARDRLLILADQYQP